MFAQSSFNAQYLCWFVSHSTSFGFAIKAIANSQCFRSWCVLNWCCCFFFHFIVFCLLAPFWFIVFVWNYLVFLLLNENQIELVAKPAIFHYSSTMKWNLAATGANLIWHLASSRKKNCSNITSPNLNNAFSGYLALMTKNSYDLFMNKRVFGARFKPLDVDSSTWTSTWRSKNTNVKIQNSLLFFST